MNKQQTRTTETGPVKKCYIIAAVFALVALLQFWFVASIGTDIPFMEQWDLEGHWLYPEWLNGSLRIVDLFRAHNEHRIFWTHITNLVLFVLNGGWDPLAQLFAAIFLRAGCAALLCGILLQSHLFFHGCLLSLAVAVAYLPHLAWHNVLWGFQSQVFFSMGFGLSALVSAATGRNLLVILLGFIAGILSQLSMGSGFLLPVGFLGALLLRVFSRGEISRIDLLLGVAGCLLLVSAGLLRTTVPEHAIFHPATLLGGIAAALRVLAWPHFDTPAAALITNLPFLGVIALRLLRPCRITHTENAVVAIACWAVAIGAAAAWSRGASPEFQWGVPSRYIDFIVLLPVTNYWFGLALLRESAPRYKIRMRAALIVWSTFMFVGWAGISAEVVHGLIIPRLRDKDAPVRIAVEFQRSDDPDVFRGQPKLYIPHPSVESMRRVFHDQRMQGRMPPSFQPAVPLGPISWGIRWAVDHVVISSLLFILFTVAGAHLVARWGALFALSNYSSNERT